MRVPSARGCRWAAAVACLTALSLVGLAGCTPTARVASDPESVSRSSPGPGETMVRVLQMNLCNSGRAPCYTGGRAVGMATAVVRRHRPDVVTLNEVCRDDVRVLELAMSAASSGGRVGAAFVAARDRPDQSPVRCQNGEEFGDGVLVLLPSRTAGLRRHSGVYPMQDPEDPEERVWVCVDTGTLSACTTHTASVNPVVALDQCRYLLTSVVPTIGRRSGGQPTVLGADLNLAAGGSPGPQACLPDGFHRSDDAGRQDVVTSPGITARWSRVIDMHGTTDHPGLLVDVSFSALKSPSTAP